MKKRVLGFILVLTMVTSLIPTDFVTGIKTTFAAEEITRLNWVRELTQLFEMSATDANLPEDYFYDVEPEAEYFKDVMTAAAFGVIDIEAGVSFFPHEPVTREFAAQTMNFCLGFVVEENEEINLGDLSEITFPTDAWVAVERGWFTLNGGNFMPHAPVTAEEKEAIFADTFAVWHSTDINPSNENIYEFSEGVRVIPDGTEFTEENGVITFVHNPQIVENDIFVVFYYGLPVAYKAVSVDVQDDATVILTEEFDTWEIIEYANASNEIEVDLSQIIPAEDTIVTYIEGGTAELNFEDGIEHDSVETLSSKTYSLNLNRTIPLPQGNLHITGLIHNIRVTNAINRDMSFVKVTGNSTVTITADFNIGSIGNERHITLGTFDIYGVGKVIVGLYYQLDGTVALTFDNSFEAGVQRVRGDRTRIIQKFYT